MTTSARKRHLQNVRGPRGGRKRRHGLTNAVGTQLRNIGTKHFPCDIGPCHVFEHGTRMKSTTALEKEIGCSWAGAAQTRRSAPSWTRCDHRGSATNLRMTALGGPHRHLQRLKISPGADVGCVQRPGACCACSRHCICCSCCSWSHAWSHCSCRCTTTRLDERKPSNRQCTRASAWMQRIENGYRRRLKKKRGDVAGDSDSQFLGLAAQEDLQNSAALACNS